MKRLKHRLKSAPVIELIWIFLLIIASACQPFEPEQLVIIETGNVSELGISTCTVHGELLDIGANGVTQHGFVWSDSPNPTIETADLKQLGPAADPGTFEYQITGLSPSTNYHVRSYARSGDDIVFGGVKSFETMAGSVPSVGTVSPTEVTFYSAVCGGDILDDGGAPVTARGICWSTNPEPTLENDYTADGEGIGRYESIMDLLNAGSRYYVRAYAINEIGIGYGGDFYFFTPWDNSPATDFEGNNYPTVQIGDMVWTAMNLASTMYADGTPIPLVESNIEWSEQPDTKRAFCYYNNEFSVSQSDGALYTWAAATNGHPGSNEVPSQVQGVCPTGWHLPSDEEWKMFELTIGMTEDEINSLQWRGTNQGGRLKEAGINWNAPNVGATNELGFNARPSGGRTPIGEFVEYGNATDFWSATDSGGGGAWFRGLHTGEARILRDGYPKNLGFSVRCVKDH